MSYDFSDILDLLNEDVFEETPATIEEFVTQKDYLGLPPLSDEQYDLIKASTQIYKQKTLEDLLPEDEAMKRWSQTFNEVVAIWGKGSGKDYCSEISCCYIVHLLLCLKNPQEYFGKPPGDYIDIMNIALNAQQANNVFFKGLRARVRNSPWFEGRFDARGSEIEFDKSIRIISGHSESESLEGYNVLVVVLDEIAGFDQAPTTGLSKRITADSTYKMHRASVSSRFGKEGKLILLSFPRHKSDFIMTKYNEVVAEKEVVKKTHEFKLDPELPDDIESNKFKIEWEEDVITAYRFPGVYAIRRPTWAVNPTKKIDDFALSFYRDTADSMGRFAAQPPETVDAFFHDDEVIDRCLSQPNGVDETGKFRNSFKPDPEKQYFIHVDLAQVHDRAAVAVAHVENWKQTELFGQKFSIQPYIVVDCVRYWTPTKQDPIDFKDIQEFIISLKNHKFNIKLVSFDQWNSFAMMEELSGYGMKTKRFSVANDEYIDVKQIMHEGRLQGPDIPILKEEIRRLRLFPNGKIDHPYNGSKDLLDAMAGAIVSAAANSDRNSSFEIEVMTAADIREHTRKERELERPGKVIKEAPKNEMPNELRDFITKIKMF